MGIGDDSQMDFDSPSFLVDGHDFTSKRSHRRIRPANGCVHHLNTASLSSPRCKQDANAKHKLAQCTHTTRLDPCSSYSLGCIYTSFFSCPYTSSEYQPTLSKSLSTTLTRVLRTVLQGCGTMGQIVQYAPHVPIRRRCGIRHGTMGRILLSSAMEVLMRRGSWLPFHSMASNFVHSQIE